MNTRSLDKALAIHPEYFDQLLADGYEYFRLQLQTEKDRRQDLKELLDLTIADKKRIERKENKNQRIIAGLNREIQIHQVQHREDEEKIEKLEKKNEGLIIQLRSLNQSQWNQQAVFELVVLFAQKVLELISENDQLKTELERALKSNSTNGGFSSSFDVGSHSLSKEEKEAKKARKPEAKEEEKKEAEEFEIKRTPVSSREKSGRSKGGQPGHPAHVSGLDRNPDTVIEKRVKSAPRGARAVRNERGKLLYYVSQETDLIVQSRVTEIHWIPDPEGEELSEADARKFRVNPTAYSDSMKAKTVYLYEYGVVSLNRLSDMLSVLTDGRISVRESTIVNWVRQAASKAEAEMKEILDEILKAEVVYIDETGVKINGVQHWMHVITDGIRVYYTITRHRGKDLETAKNILLSHGYSGIVVHDHFSSYINWPEVVHAECNVHIERYMRGGVRFDNCPMCQDMLDLLHEMLHLRHEREKAGKKKMLKKDIRRFEKRYEKICRAGMKYWEDQVNEKGESLKRYTPPYYPTFRRMLEFKEDHLRFIKDFTAPYSNNLAEQCIQEGKMRKRVSKQFGSEQGAGDYAAIRSVMATARRTEGSNILNVIENLFTISS